MAGKKGNYELEIMISGGTDQSLDASIRKAKGQISSLERRAGLSAKGIGDSFGGMSEGIDALAKVSDNAFGIIVKGGKAAAAGMVGIIGASTMVGMGFEAQMSTVQAISQASESDMKSLNALAKEMGATTKFTAEEAGKGLEYMAMAGWKTKDMIAGLPGVMYLAAASGEDLGSVSDIVTDAMTAFGMQADQAAYFADVLAQASSSSNTNVGMMGATFQYVAPIAGAYGYNIKDVAVATGLMANAGIKGEKAGTALRTMLTNLAKPTKEMKKYMGALSISLVDGKGNMKPFGQQMVELREHFSKLTAAQKAEYAAGIAGKQGMSGLLAIVNASDSDFENLTSAIDNSSGAARQMSEVRLDNLKGDLTLLSSAAQGAGIEIYEGLSGTFRGTTKDATAWISSFTDDLEENIPTARRYAKQFGDAMKTFFGPAVDLGKWFIKNPNVLKGGITGVASALATFKAAKMAKDGIGLLSKLPGLITAWPVAAAGVVIGGIVGISTAIKEADRMAAQQNLAEHFGNITLSMKDLEEAAKQTLGPDLFSGLDAFSEASDKSAGLYQSMQKQVQEINRAGWKLSLGIKFDENDTQSYAAAVNEYVQNAQDYITSKGYEVNLAVKLIMGDSDQGFSEGGDAFYASLLAQLEPLKKDINDALSKVTEEGLTLPQEKLVSGYLQQMAEITQQITDAENAADLQIIQGNFSAAGDLSPESYKNYQAAVTEWNQKAMEGVDAAHRDVLVSLNARRNAGPDQEGGVSQEEFERLSREESSNYYAKKAEVSTQGYEALKDPVMDKYGSEINPAVAAVDQQIGQSLESIKNNQSNTPEWWHDTVQQSLWDAADASTLSKSPGTKGAVTTLFGGLNPYEKQMWDLVNQFDSVSNGESNPAIDQIREMLKDTEKIRAAAGDEKAIQKLFGGEIGDDKTLSTTVLAARQNGGAIPDGVIAAINEKQPEAETAARDFLNVIKETLENGTGTVNIPIPVTYEMTESYLNTGNTEPAQAGKIHGGGVSKRIINVTLGAAANVKIKPDHYAKGGLISEPTLSWFAEDSPEMAIPIDGSSRSTSLWREAGRLLGAYEENNYDRIYGSLVSPGSTIENENTSSFAPVFSPAIYVQGGQDVSGQVMSGLQEGYEQFVEYMERFDHEKHRVSF